MVAPSPASSLTSPSPLWTTRHQRSEVKEAHCLWGRIQFTYTQVFALWLTGLHQPAAGGGGWRSLCDRGAPAGSRPGQPRGGAEGGGSEDGASRPPRAAGSGAAAGRHVHPAGCERTPTQVRPEHERVFVGWFPARRGSVSFPFVVSCYKLTN